MHSPDARSPLTTDGGVVRRSVEAILRNQADNGAIIASPDFAQYHFCWLRDGSFSAYALDVAGEHEASARYHAWVARAVDGIATTMSDAIAAHRAGEVLDPVRMPPARFAMDGSTVVDDWPNFQVDGYGTWLWSLRRHIDLGGSDALPEHLLESARRVARYLKEFALHPCYDVWEENGGARHTSTLACVYGGLIAGAQLLGDEECERVADEVRSAVLASAASAGYFTKFAGDRDVDASCLWLASPFGLVDSKNEYFAKTVRLIEDRLSYDGGLRRYPGDVYFGGGAWPVLTASLGWHYASVGNFERANRCRGWIEDRIDAEGRLAEQFGGESRDHQHFEEWVSRWGAPARDLTWSHATLVVLSYLLDRPDPVSIMNDRGVRAPNRGTEVEVESTGGSGAS